MRTFKSNNKTPTSLQEELSEYNLMRNDAKSNAKKGVATGPKFFGLAEVNGEYKMTYPEDIRDLDRDDSNNQYKIAVVAPDNEAFDILAPKDYTKKLKLTNETNLRKYLHKLIDSLP